MPQNLKPAPLPPQSLRQQLGVPEGISDATLQDLLYAKQPKPQMEEMFTPADLGPPAIRAAGLIGGGALAAGTGPVGLIGAGALNVFADHLASKMEALNKGEIPPNTINVSRAAPAFLSGAILAGMPVAEGPLGYVQSGLTNAAYQTGERALSGEPITQQGLGEAALMGTAAHGAFQGAGKMAATVAPSVRGLFRPPVEGQRVAAEVGAAPIGEKLPKGVTKAPDWPGVGRGYHVDVGQEGPTTIYVPEGEDLIPHLQKTYRDFGIDPSTALKGLKR